MTAPVIDAEQTAPAEHAHGQVCEVLHVPIAITPAGTLVKGLERRCDRPAVARLVAACSNGHVETLLICAACRDGVLAGDRAGCDACPAPMTAVAVEPIR